MEKKIGIIGSIIGIGQAVLICLYAFGFNATWPPSKGDPDFTWAMWFGPILLIFLVVCLASIIFYKPKPDQPEPQDG